MKKKTLLTLMTFAMLLSMLPAAVFAAGDGTTPDMSGSVINVTAAQAQDVLDGKYGDITGKTIHFTENVTDVLDLARPTRYRESGTIYYNYVNSQLETTPTEWNENISAVMNNHSHYYRTLENVTFTADAGVTVAGFTFSAGHVASSGYDHVRDVEQTAGVTYYKHSSLENVTFQGLTVTGQFDAKLYTEDSTVSGVTFDGCTLTGTTDDGSNAAIKFLADNQYFTNITVKNCSISDYFQGVYVQGVDNAEIADNTIRNTAHNAVALQSFKNPAKGSVKVAENYITNVTDRAIRMNVVDASADIAINNNVMVNCGDADGQLIKATTVTEGATINLESNYWDGKAVSIAVAGLTAPTTVGLTSGDWTDADIPAISDYVADGYTIENGTVGIDPSAAAAKVGNKYYLNMKEAMTAADGMTGDIVVEVYGEVEFTDGMELNGSYTSITFNQGGDGAKIIINQSAGGDYLEAHGKTVAFNNLTLAKANPAWAYNSGHMGNYFSIQGGTVTYTNCTFSNGACTSGGAAEYNNCTFQNTSEYGLWVYDNAIVNVNGGKIDSRKGIKIYSEAETSVTSTLTVEGATFTATVTDKPAVAIGYAESITLIGNTFENITGVLELDSGTDADCEGVTFVAKNAEGEDISSTLTAIDRSNTGAACGVLMDGKIYTTVAEAAKDAEPGDTVTLLHNSAESVTLPKGVTLDKNNYTANSVTVAQPAEVCDYDGLVAALSAGEDVKLTADVFVDTAITVPDNTIIDLNDKTLYINVENSCYNDAAIKNGNIVLGKDDVHVCDGYFLVNNGKTLLLDDVNVSSSADGIKGYAVFHLKTGASLNLNKSTLNISNNEYSSGYIMYANEATATLNFTDTAITASKVNGIVHATTVMSGSTFTLTDAVEHGINRSAVTLNDSDVTISGGTGRGITPQHGDLLVNGTSTVTISDMAEASIQLRDDAGMTVAETATVTVDKAVSLDSGATGMVSGTVIDTSKTVTITFNSKGGSEVRSITQTYGSKIADLPVPAKNGYLFAGWYSDEACTTEFTSDTVVTESITVYAKWNKRSSGISGPARYAIAVEDSRNGNITVSPTRASSGRTVTITVDPDDGYQSDELVVLDKNGKEVKLTRKSETQYTFKMPSGEVTIEVTFAEIAPFKNPFMDVAESAYYYDAVLWAAEKGITGGTSATAFSPDAPCTRAQMATFLWRTAGSPEPEGGTNPFVDVPADAYYAKAVQWAYALGITGGTSATTFSPDLTCTRGQMATFLWRNSGSPVTVSSAHFDDVSADAYYAAAIQWVYEQGITVGTSAITFSPNDSCTRAQMVTFLYRYLGE